MAKATEKDEGFDLVEDSQTFSEQIGKQDAPIDGDMLQYAEDDTSVVHMPDESMEADESMSFREQLPTSDGDDTGDTKPKDSFTAAAEEQIDEPE